MLLVRTISTWHSCIRNFLIVIRPEQRLSSSRHLDRHGPGIVIGIARNTQRPSLPELHNLAFHLSLREPR